jgi:hypothetical protein
MNRRGFFGFLGKAPVAIPLTITAVASAAALPVVKADEAVDAAIARLAAYYNGDAHDPKTNPGGLAAGGHRENFVKALQDFARVASKLSAPPREAE